MSTCQFAYCGCNVQVMQTQTFACSMSHDQCFLLSMSYQYILKRDGSAEFKMPQNYHPFASSLIPQTWVLFDDPHSSPTFSDCKPSGPPTQRLPGSKNERLKLTPCEGFSSWLANLPPRKLTWQWNIHNLKMCFLFKMGMSVVMSISGDVMGLSRLRMTLYMKIRIKS